jgi:hypothetical protein
MMTKRLTFIFLLFISLNANAFNDASAISHELQTELMDDYLPSIQDILGHCEDGDCLIQGPGHSKKLKINETESICFPYTECDFYRCMEEKYGCMQVGVNYFMELALPTCNQYVKNVGGHKFSKDGVEWIYSVMVCLQKGLVDECEVSGNCHKETQKKTCDYITDFTLKFHPGCYINSGKGICHLPLADKMAIWKTVRPFLTPREKIEAYKVIFHCLTQG